jgi:thiol-disulfide isomerase/thioredoxin
MANPRSKIAKSAQKGRFPWEPLAFFVLIVALIGSGIYLYLDQSSSGDGSDGDVDAGTSGDTTPSHMRIPIQDVEGGEFNLSIYKGKVILLDMFATWCDPCMTQLGELQKVRDHYPESEVVIITVDVDTRESASEVKELKDERGLTWRFAMSNARFSGLFPASSIPTLYYLDQDGKIADKAVGAESFSEVRDRIEGIKNG